MTGFLTGAFLAVVLSAVTWFALENFAVTSIERVNNPSLKLEGVNQEYLPPHDTNRAARPQE